MSKHLLSNVSFLNNKGYLKLADSLHFNKYILVTVVTSTSITTDGIELLHSFFMTCKIQTITTFSRVISEHLVKILAFKIRNSNTANPKPKLLSIAKLPILADVPCRLHGNYVGITLLKLNSTHEFRVTVQSYLIWRQALLAVPGASLVPPERDHVPFITRRLPVEVANALARSGRWLSKSRSEPDHSLSIYGNETTQNWPCKRSKFVDGFVELFQGKYLFIKTNKTKLWTFMRVPLPIALMEYLPTLLQCIHLHSFVLHTKQETNQYVYKLLQSHKSQNTLKYYYINTVEW